MADSPDPIALALGRMTPARFDLDHGAAGLRHLGVFHFTPEQGTSGLADVA